MTHLLNMLMKSVLSPFSKDTLLAVSISSCLVFVIFVFIAGRIEITKDCFRIIVNKLSSAKQIVLSDIHISDMPRPVKKILKNEMMDSFQMIKVIIAFNWM